MTDPRDERIAELEAALRNIVGHEVYTGVNGDWKSASRATALEGEGMREIARRALAPSPLAARVLRYTEPMSLYTRLVIDQAERMAEDAA
jgi:hypothetical protein